MQLNNDQTVSLTTANAVEAEPLIRSALAFFGMKAASSPDSESHASAVPLRTEMLPRLLPDEAADTPVVLVQLPTCAASEIPALLEASVEIVNLASMELRSSSTYWVMSTDTARLELNAGTAAIGTAVWAATEAKQLILIVEAAGTVWMRKLTERAFGDAESLQMLVQVSSFVAINDEPHLWQLDEEEMSTVPAASSFELAKAESRKLKWRPEVFELKQ